MTGRKKIHGERSDGAELSANHRIPRPARFQNLHVLRRTRMFLTKSKGMKGLRKARVLGPPKPGGGAVIPRINVLATDRLNDRGRAPDCPVKYALAMAVPPLDPQSINFLQRWIRPLAAKFSRELVEAIANLSAD